MEKGVFVAFEGIIGSSKLIIDCVDELKKNFSFIGKPVTVVHSEDAGRVDAMGADKMFGTLGQNSLEPLVLQELAARSAWCHNQIIPGLKKGHVILSKNWTIGSRVNFVTNFINQLMELKRTESLSRGFDPETRIRPDFFVFIDIEPEFAYEKMKAKGMEHEKGLEYYSDMRQRYILELSKINKSKKLTVCGSRTIEDISQEIYKAAMRYCEES